MFLAIMSIKFRLSRSVHTKIIFLSLFQPNYVDIYQSDLHHVFY